MSLIYNPPSSNKSLTQGGKRRHGLYIGGQKDAKNREKLNKWGITHILNVTPEKEGGVQSGIQNYFPSHYTYKRIPVYDLATSDLLQYASQITSFISKGLHHGSVFVHCKKGRSRSVTCVLFYLIQKCQMGFNEALNLVKEKREGADPIPAFINQTKQWEKKLITDGILKSSNTSKNGIKMTVGIPKGPVSVSMKGPTRGPSRGPAKRPTTGPMLPPAPKENLDHTITGPTRSISNQTIGPIVGPSIGPDSRSGTKIDSLPNDGEREGKRQKRNEAK